ncbi:hypothetical protein Tdes44962_MAKER09524 [Teratosphaeria destructans]|uniref:Uncharacterized protein n=1 Tax=Teratosphaeria destructans TaxID=418781 RepID=A0A9W7W319_9PEZI|nr:hypothetical protein Tdes44962_MAKER09524 [Teratosphaeria destructans]
MAPTLPLSREQQKGGKSSTGSGGRSGQRSTESSALPTGVQKVSKNKVPVTKTAKGNLRKAPTGRAVSAIAHPQHRGKPIPEPPTANARFVRADGGLEDLRMRTTPDSRDLFHQVKEYSGLTFKDDKDARLRLALRIIEDPDSNRTRLFYQLRIYLSHKADGADVEDDEIGHFECYRLSRPTAKHAHVDPLWIKEYLRLDLRKMEYLGDLVPGTRQEIAKVVQALYSPKTALPKRNFRRSIAQALQENSFFYILAIYLREPYTRNQLLPQIMTRFCSMLGALPEWFAFAGNVILTPGWMLGPRGQQWTVKYEFPRDIAQVTSVLEAMYNKIAFETWVQDTQVERSKNWITVMCRIIPGDEDTIMADVDEDEDDGNDWYYDYSDEGEEDEEDAGDTDDPTGEDGWDADEASDHAQGGAGDGPSANDDFQQDDESSLSSSLSSLPSSLDDEPEFLPSSGGKTTGSRAQFRSQRSRMQTRSQTEKSRLAG